MAVEEADFCVMSVSGRKRTWVRSGFEDQQSESKVDFRSGAPHAGDGSGPTVQVHRRRASATRARVRPSSSIAQRFSAGTGTVDGS